ncbi:ORF6N domain-containing protein [Pseudomonas putida]|uniref:ORF6N domain-containing protein n=1 Tax=Pseudomonas putida TaxID=303 RepID=UPI002363F4B4|nr:ORF6N domain-containing protein [Pseudomonas putida]MDD2026997.1 ORF6N domain-containing protein [Pseudomonas putida]HDS1765740.1 ORF6N domain-containing protein [Pseudomonas putida]
MSQITIHNTRLPVVEYRGQRVVTLAMIDQVHERPEGTARRNFNEHRAKLIEGSDFFKVCADEIRTHNIVKISPRAHEDVTFLTEQGYLMLVKSLTDDLAWTVQRQLVSNYFRPAPGPMLPQDLPAALRLAADLAEEKAVLALENQQQAKKIEALESLFMPGETVPQFAKRLNGVNSQQVMAYLIHIKWVFNSERDPDSSPKYRVYAEARDKHWLTEKPTTIRGEGIPSFIKYTPVMLEEGARRLHDMYLAGKLPMKQTWNGEFFYTKFNPENSL